MEAWEQYTAVSGRRFEDFSKFVYHLPFTKMGEKAHSFLVKHAAEALDESEWLKQIEDAAVYQRVIGNTYAASVFAAFQSLLDVSTEDLSGKRIGLFSYGSGSVGEFFSGAVLPDYRTHLHSSRHLQMINSRIALDYRTYADFYSYKSNMPTDGSSVSTPRHKTGSFRFAGLQEHRRLYEVVG
jgi:hydroxymethylglutaryl-CoA synthase